jgi:hypothetical protein
MFYFVPFAGSGRKVANADDQSRLIRKLLHLYFPQAQPITIATAAIGRDDELSGFGIEPPAFATPPPANGGHGKSPGVMICSYVYKTGVPAQVINPVGIGAWNRGIGKIMAVRQLWRMLLPPLTLSLAKIPSALKALTLASPAGRLLNHDRSTVFVDFISKIRVQESN